MEQPDLPCTVFHSVKELFLTIKSSLIKNANLRIAVLFSAFTGTATLTFAWLVQPFLKELEVPVAWFGIIRTLLNLTVGLASAVAYKFENQKNKARTTFLILLLISIGFISTGFAITMAGIAFLFLFYICRMYLFYCFNGCCFTLDAKKG